MALAEYNKRRSFKETPEPKGTHERPHPKGPLHFVVQKHAARSLHYDFRLELDGVLKSWAVPKGPSMDTADKRLAIMTEDHPLEYAKFQGTIPKGHYGAGKVETWDKGVYSSVDSADPEETRKKIKNGLHKGEIKFLLQGEKLEGGFALIKMKSGGQNQWLLVKERDEYSTNATKLRLRRSGEDTMPQHVKPMLAKPVDQPFDKNGWYFEPKWDGYRAIAEIGGGEVKLYSRNGKSFADIYKPVVDSLKRIKHDCVLDGEIIAIRNGREDFHTLQQYQEKAAPLRYQIFDLLYLDGRDLRGEPLHERKDLLQKIIPKDDVLRYSEHVMRDGGKFFQKMRRQGREGMIAKNASSRYREGVRGDEWLKIKSVHEQEAIIIGYTEPRGSRKHLGSLVLGAYVNGQLRYVGHSGGGFTDTELKQLRAKLQKIAVIKPTVAEEVPVNSPITWVKPKYVAQIKFTEWTPDGRMRHPIYAGLRIDKKPSEVKKEIQRTSTIDLVGRYTPQLTHLDKVFWPKESYTKGDLIAYYESVAEILLPYLKDRPENLNRHPNGIMGKSFYHKNWTTKLPDFVERTKVWSEHNNDFINYIVCNNKETLLYMANLGCIELNPWNSRVGSLEKPDYMILDLDPHERPFGDLVKVALVVKDVLDVACENHLIKTSGKSGLHVCVPLGARYKYKDVRVFAEILMRIVHLRLPEITSIERNPKKRKAKIYLDYLQNSLGQTLACAYSVRPHAGATVSTPLEWREVGKGLDPSKFTIKTMAKRLKQKGDLWKPILGKGVDLAEAIHRLAKLISR